MLKVSISIIICNLIALKNVSSFTSSMKTVRRSALSMTTDIDDSSVEESIFSEEVVTIETELNKMSISMPFMERPAVLTGALAGDVGFDPLGFAKTEEELMQYREAEVKHARLAMLAAAGWPLSEVLDKKIAYLFGLDPLLDSSDRVPSLLNGGLGKVSPIYWIGCFAVAAAIDVLGIMRKNAASEVTYIPGDLGFDPFGVYPKDESGQKRMQTAEIKNGRLAMIAIFAFAIQEAVTKIGVVNETPLFFFPLGETLKNYANSGYVS
mmetsp:Transcript_233/g.204  ORF Transcript_233/g.204 Transcript_233/m.204 type:complete len:266 (+) Transcript_233:81-878(+)